MTKACEGYLILATGSAHYADMACNLAASIKVMDGTRPICLVHDGNIALQPADRALFDDLSVLPPDSRYPGFMNKIRLFPVSPYQRTMFVDADCLLVKRDIDRYWAMTRPFFFGITGDSRMSGEWKGADIAAMLRQEGAPYLVQMNSGVFAFDNSPEAAAFFAGLNDFYLRRRNQLGIGLHRGKPAQTDEIYIGLWMGLNGLESCGGKLGENSWMVSTWRALRTCIDPGRGRSLIHKPRHAIAGVPNPIGGWDRLSPSFVHFIGLKPRRTYQRLSAYFRTCIAEAM
jgi:hypothetical protein